MPNYVTRIKLKTLVKAFQRLLVELTPLGELENKNTIYCMKVDEIQICNEAWKFL